RTIVLPTPATVPDAVTLVPSDPVAAPEIEPVTADALTCSAILSESVSDTGATLAPSPSRWTMTGSETDEAGAAPAGRIQSERAVRNPCRHAKSGVEVSGRVLET